MQSAEDLLEVLEREAGRRIEAGREAAARSALLYEPIADAPVAPDGRELVFLSWGGDVSLRVATALQAILHPRLPGAEVFLSATSIDPGDDPIRTMLEEGVLRSSVLVAALTSEAMIRPWVVWETASAWARGQLVIPIFIDIAPADVPGPLTTRVQGVQLIDRQGLDRAIGVIANRLGINHVARLTDKRVRAADHGGEPLARLFIPTGLAAEGACTFGTVHIKPPVEPGEYEGVVELPDGKAQAQFTLASDRPPTFRAYDRPLQTGGFPKPALDYKRLVCRLRTNQDLVLGDAQTEDWAFGVHLGSARWGLVGLGVAAHERWEQLAVQVSGLEILLRRPIDEVAWPKDGALPRQEHSVVVAPCPVEESAHDGVRVRPQYNVSFSVTDPYQHQVATVAETVFRADTALEVDRWIEDWLQPFSTLVGIGTGRRERLRLVALQNGALDPPERRHPVRGMLFGSGIGQDPAPAERQLDANGNPIVPLFSFDNAPPLADLVVTWRTLSEDLAALPLLRLSQDPALHPGVRFLLLANAAESFHASTIASDESTEYERRRTRLKEVLSTVRTAGLAEEHRFLRDCAEARRPYPLARRLRDLLEDSTLSPRLGMWDERTAELDRRLRDLGRDSTDLAERLAHSRNVLSHGSAHFPPSVLQPAVELLDLVVRLAVLQRLGFDAAQLEASVDRLSRS